MSLAAAAWFDGFFAVAARPRYASSGTWFMSRGGHMRIRQIGIVLVVVLVAAVAACGGKKKDDATMKGPTRSLYDRLGGKDSISLVVNDFVDTTAKNEKIKQYFLNTDLKNLKEKLVEQICEASGGPCKYTGKDMKTVHATMKLTEEDFNALVGDLVQSLDKFKVGEQEKNELLTALGGMKGDIVTQ
jgi:hemoglobin